MIMLFMLQMVYSALSYLMSAPVTFNLTSVLSTYLYRN